MEENKHLFRYKDEVKVGPLAMIGDIIFPIKCGSQAVAANSYITSKIEMNKLEASQENCKTIRIGKDKTLCSDVMKVNKVNIKKK